MNVSEVDPRVLPLKCRIGVIVSVPGGGGAASVFNFNITPMKRIDFVRPTSLSAYDRDGALGGGAKVFCYLCEQ